MMRRHERLLRHRGAGLLTVRVRGMEAGVLLLMLVMLMVVLVVMLWRQRQAAHALLELLLPRGGGSGQER